MHRKLKCIHTYRKEREIGRRLNLKIMKLSYINMRINTCIHTLTKTSINLFNQ
jgi:hypothetical protein